MRRLGIPRWLYPGMHLKRWLVLIFVGLMVFESNYTLLTRVLFFATGS